MRSRLDFIGQNSRFFMAQKMVRRPFSLAALLALLAAGVAVDFGSAAHANQPGLKDVFKKDFLIGAALNQNQFIERDQRGLPIITSQFNSITPENVLKWEAVNRQTLLLRMRDHIHTVVGRYKGRIKGWDVVNEALDEDGTLRQTPWMKIIGEDYLVKAFEFAREADPSAQLYYNDYSLENEAKRKGAIDLIKKLKARSVSIYAVGLQGHDKMDWPTAQQQSETIVAFASLGVKVNITELDVDVLPRASQHRGADISLNVELRAQLNPYANGLPDSVQQALAKRYAELFEVFRKHRAVIDRVTFWGVTDGDSWLNDWPVRGRTSYPLLFDRMGRPKPAFYAVTKLKIADRG
jgi:endo-1,4-beta-xylanase